MSARLLVVPSYAVAERLGARATRRGWVLGDQIVRSVTSIVMHGGAHGLTLTDVELHPAVSWSPQLVEALAPGMIAGGCAS